MKPYDLNELLKSLKDSGLNVTETAARDLVEKVFAWVEASAKASPTAYDDLMLVILPALKTTVLKEVDKINGKVGA